MNLWEDSEIVALLQHIVARGCVRYRRVFAAAGLDGEPSLGVGLAAFPQEVYHEFLLHLAHRGVALESVEYPKAYFSRAFRNFAEDLRERVERSGLVYGNLEEDGDRPDDARDAATSAVARAVRERELANAAQRSEEGDFPVEEILRRLGGAAERDQLHGLLENYPLVRDSPALSQRLRVLYRAVYGEDFPEQEADELWETARSDEFARLRERSELVKASLSLLRQRRVELLSLGEVKMAATFGDRIAALLLREAELADRCAYLLRLKPSHVLRILPAPRRPTLNALTVALHRSRERLAACG